MNRKQRLKIIEGYTEAERIISELTAQRDELLKALELVANSGPLHNGLRDDNTLAIVRVILVKNIKLKNAGK